MMKFNRLVLYKIASTQIKLQLLESYLQSREYKYGLRMNADIIETFILFERLYPIRSKLTQTILSLQDVVDSYKHYTNVLFTHLENELYEDVIKVIN